MATGEEKGLRGKVTKHGEEAIGKVAQAMLENAMLTAAASAALEARGRAVKAQEAAMGALNLPSASDLERLTRRLRSVSQRLEAIEDSLDRVSDRVEGIGTLERIEQRLDAIEAALGRIEGGETGAAAGDDA